MNHASLQFLTWGTVSGAVVSAMLLALAGDDGEFWRADREWNAVGRGTNLPAARPGMVPRVSPPGASRASGRPAGDAKR